MIQLASILYVVGSLGIILFQLCLIAGAPWGRLTQGGKTDGSLPTSGRIVAAVNVFLFCSDEFSNVVGGRLLAKLADLGRLDDTGHSSRFRTAKLDYTIRSGKEALGAYYFGDVVTCFDGDVIHVDLAESRSC